MELAAKSRLFDRLNEIEVDKKYLIVEPLRLDSRLRVSWNIGKFPRKAFLPVLTPPLILENAIRHGIEEIANGGMADVQL